MPGADAGKRLEMPFSQSSKRPGGWKIEFFLSDFRIPLPYLQYSMEDNSSGLRYSVDTKQTCG